MDGIWKLAIKIGGVISVPLFVFWSLAKDMIPKFSVLNSFQTLVLAGLILFFISIIILILIKKETPKGENIIGSNSSSSDNKQGNREANINIGGNNSGINITGNNNSVSK